MARIEVDGINEAIAALQRFGEIGDKEAGKALDKTALKVRGDAVKSIQRGTKSGRVYERSGGKNRGATHRASAPGEAPATDTGALVSSIQTSRRDLVAKVFSRLKYSHWLEFGTLYMEPRPYLAPALRANEEYLAQALALAFNTAAKAYNAK